MAQTTLDLPEFADHLKENFSAIAPLILEEWTHLDANALRATEGDPERVVAYLSKTTEHTRTLIRRQLQELIQIAAMQPPKPSPSGVKKELHQFVQEHIPDTHLKQTIDQLEAKTEKLLQQFKQEVLPELEEQVQKNPAGSLLTALGIGFVLGLLLGGSRGR